MANATQSVNTPNQPVINFTDAAAKKVKSLIDEEKNPKLNLRVYIMGGGCSGFQYGFKFDENISDDDVVVEKFVPADNDEDGGEGSKDEDDGGSEGGSVKLLCDPLSFQYLEAADIDYREDVNGAQFVIRNPNAKTTCGCGSSFSV